MCVDDPFEEFVCVGGGRVVLFVSFCVVGGGVDDDNVVCQVVFVHVVQSAL